jgi:hypothetical protein
VPDHETYRGQTEAGRQRNRHLALRVKLVIRLRSSRRDDSPSDDENQHAGADELGEGVGELAPPVARGRILRHISIAMKKSTNARSHHPMNCSTFGKKFWNIASAGADGKWWMETSNPKFLLDDLLARTHNLGNA